MLDARALAERSVKGEDVRDPLHHALVHLASLLRAHNQREEELMKDVFPTLDAWGPIRKEIMLEEHVEEHQQVVDALMTASSAPDAVEAAKKTIKLFDRLLGHMAREEKVFLSEDVLSDEGVPPDWFGG